MGNLLSRSHLGSIASGLLGLGKLLFSPPTRDARWTKAGPIGRSRTTFRLRAPFPFMLCSVPPLKEYGVKLAGLT